VEAEIGGSYTPKIYDSKDLYDYFTPVTFYKDKANKPLKMDFKKFNESEALYKEALEEIDKELNEIKKSALEEDGVSPEDSEPPIENLEESDESKGS
jgi:hypothetical protein